MKIRTVKPEFWQSEKLASITHGARLLFIGLFCMADDHGRFRAHPSLIRGEVFPFEENAVVERWLAELVAIGVVRLYQVSVQTFGVVVNFAEHQKIDKRWASRLPAPPADPNAPGPGAAPRATNDHGTDRDQPAVHEPGVADAGTHPAVLPVRAPAGSPAGGEQADRRPGQGDGREAPAVSRDDSRPAQAPGGQGLLRPRSAPAEVAASDAEQPARLATCSGSLADSTPTDRIGSDRKGKEPLRSARAREGPGEPEPQKQSGTRKPPDDAVLALQAALRDSRYRDETKPEGTRTKLLLARAIDLAAAGMTLEDLAHLVELDREKSRKGPGSLLAIWIDRRQWRDVLAEQRMKTNEAGGAADRAKAEQDLLQGIYGADPLPAASVVDAVLSNARPA